MTFYLAQYPDVQTKMGTEIDTVLNENPNTPISELLPKFVYCRQVLLECLRLKPPFPALVREAAEDCVLKDLKIAKGTNLVLHLHNAHMNPQHWDRPSEFRPERFAKEDNDRHPYAFLPFYAGERNCIGQKLAMEEGLIYAVHLLQNFRIKSPNLDKVFPGFISLLLSPCNLQIEFVPKNK